jgi:trans-aconitate 2-methyltransferase
MSDWDAARYHRVSDPQRAWGLSVLERLAPASGERILDIGCGTARLTSDILRQAPSARVTAMDRSGTMLGEAKRTAAPAIQFVRASAVELPFTTAFDAVFSTATFHWVPDHSRLFSEIHRVLRPGGRLVAQAGGGPNLARLYGRTACLALDDAFATHFEGWNDPWTFAGVDDTHARMEDAGFTDVAVWLESTPTSFADAETFSEFVETVCLRHQLDRLPEVIRSDYLRRITQLAATDDPPFTLDYWRLNIDGRK